MLILASGCGASAPAAKQADAKPANSTAEKKADATAGSTKSAATPAQQTVDKPKDDIWTYYNDAKWIDDFNGLKSEVEKVVVTDKGPKVQDGQIVDGQFVSYVGVKFKLTNTTKDKFTAYPDQARLVTSTGEQIEDPDMNGTDHIGGEIDEGVTKEGNIVWKLKKGHATDIQWVKLTWDTHPGGEDKLDSRKKYEIKIQLKP